jgi:hypothetical protein
MPLSPIKTFGSACLGEPEEQIEEIPTGLSTYLITDSSFPYVLFSVLFIILLSMRTSQLTAECLLQGLPFSADEGVVLLHYARFH